ncbi:MAG: glycosyltransferase family 87 protein [Candidatus Thorarchaeota archaeon]
MVGRLRRGLGWGFLTVAIVIQIQFIFSLETGWLNSLFYDTQYLVGQGPDFFSYYQAGNNILNGIDVYTIPDPLAVPYLYPFRYLPYFAYSFGVIINLADPISAYWTWIGVLIFSVWLAAFQTRSVAKKLNRPDWEGHVGMGLWFMFTPIYIELYVGQVTLIAGILMFFALTTPSLVNGLKTKGTMAVSWTVGALTKTIPYFIAPVLLAAGRVRTVLVAVIVTLVAIVAVPSGLEALQYFVDFNSARNSYITPYPGDHSLKMLLYYLFGEQSRDASVITILLIVLFLGLASFATLYSRDVWSCAGLFSVSYFFIMLDVWEHHYTFLIPLLVLAWIRGGSEDRARWVPVLMALVMSIPAIPIIQLLSGIGTEVHPIEWGLMWQIIYHSSKVVPTLIFYVWLLITAFRYPRADNDVDSFLDPFRNAWNGLITGNNPMAEGGILVQREKESENESTLNSVAV